MALWIENKGAYLRTRLIVISLLIKETTVNTESVCVKSV